MPGLLPEIDPDGLLEYSVVYTDRSLNHMSQAFQEVMRDISSTLKKVYNAQAVVVVPGSGTFGMEAVARQFASGKKCLVVRNGWFSFRWTQIFEKGSCAIQCFQSTTHPRRSAGSFCASSDRRGCGGNKIQKTGCGFCTARGNIIGNAASG